MIYSWKINHFTRKPLNYELYIQRLKKFNHRSNNIPSNLVQSLILDCIKASRHLQADNTTTDIPDFLGILPKVSNSVIEAELWKTLNNNRQVWNNAIIKSYINTYPKPSNPSNIIDLVVRRFHNDLDIAMENYDIIRLGITRLLEMNDYANCFKLINDSLRSHQYIKIRRNNLKRSVRSYLSILGIMYGLTFIFTQFPMECLVLSGLFYLGVGYLFINFKYPKHLGRLSWRNSNTLTYNIIHNPELFAMNRIVKYFEEHNDVNLLNYHYSKIRPVNNLNHSKLNDYTLELEHEGGHEKSTGEIQTLFRSEFKARKMMLNDLLEELNFLEFWSNSERFQWVEPDQDPAMISNFVASRALLASKCTEEKTDTANYPRQKISMKSQT